MWTSVRLVAFGLAFTLGCAGLRASDSPLHRFEKHADEESTSLIRLIANPQELDGSRVVVGGFLVIRDEYEHSLFLDENAHRAGLFANSVAVDIDGSSSDLQSRAMQLDKRYVVITGRFKAGPTAFSSGTLERIYGIVPID